GGPPGGQAFEPGSPVALAETTASVRPPGPNSEVISFAFRRGNPHNNRHAAGSAVQNALARNPDRNHASAPIATRCSPCKPETVCRRYRCFFASKAPRQGEYSARGSSRKLYPLSGKESSTVSLTRRFAYPAGPFVCGQRPLRTTSR